MRRFISLAATAALLCGPASAFAEFATPTALLQAVQSEGRPQNFSITAKGHAQDTWFAIWASGAAEGTKADLNAAKMHMNMTMDIVHGDMKVRAKGQIMMNKGQLYAKLDSMDGKYADAFMTFNALFGQKVWLQLPVDAEMMQMQMDPAMGMNGDEDAMYALTSTKFKGGYKYTLTMQPIYMDQLNESFREMMGTPRGTSDDFFPFRELANDNADFSLTVDTNAKDEFQHSSFNLSWGGGDTELMVTGSSQRQAGAVHVETPKNVWTIQDLEDHYNKLMGMPTGDEMMPVDETGGEMMEPGMTGGSSSFDTIDGTTGDEWWQPVDNMQSEDPACSDPDLSPLKKLEMQRLGECPVVRTNNSTFRR